MTQSTFTGEYNALTYIVRKDGKIIYQAGNSPIDSQLYVEKEEGVGKERMKQFCETTMAEMAEKEGILGGIKFNHHIIKWGDQNEAASHY